MRRLLRFLMFPLIVSALTGIWGCNTGPVDGNDGNDGQTDGFTLFFDTDGLANNFVNDIAVDFFRSGIWVATQKGISFYSFRDSTWTTYGSASGLPNLRVQSVALNFETVWAGTASGPASFTDSTWNELPDISVLPNTFINFIASMPSPDYSLWFGTRGGIARRSFSGQWTSFTTANGLSFEDVTSISRDTNGDIWAGTRFGLNIYNGAKWATFTANLPSTEVKTVFADSFGSLWVGTTLGAMEIHGSDRIIYGTSDGLPSPVVTDFTEDFNRVLWAGTERGAAWFNGTRWQELPLPAAVGGLPVNSIVFDALTKSVWIGTTAGLVRYQPPASQ
ncbi:MAG: ligand-binding sensor domain-containing protein [Candidatus Latescibacterota bacterium]